jgi:hypothetical protein
MLMSIGYSVPAQDLYETGILMLESTFDEWDPGPLNAGGISIVGVFDDIPDNNTPVLEMEVPGGTANSWNELLSINWDTPENSQTVTWRFQYRIRVVNVPYNHEVRLQINQDPWNGFSITHTIPAGYAEKWLFYDFLGAPFNNFNYEVLNFSLRFGAQQPQTMWLDDIRVYQSNALLAASFETRVDDRMAAGFGVNFERVDEDNAPEGFQILKTTVAAPGTAIGDAGLILSRLVNSSAYDGTTRMTFSVRSKVAPLEMRAGIADSNDLRNRVVFAQETVRVTEKDKWQVVSFLIQAPPFAAERFWYPFVQFGGQGNAEVDFDHLFVLKSDEVIDTPALIGEWAIY